MAEIDLVGTRLTSIETRLNAVADDVRAVKADVDKLQGSASMLQWLLGLGLLATLGLIFFAGKSVVAEIARDVVRQELAYRATTTQQGKFSAATRSAEDSFAFEWALKVPVDPNKVTMLAAEPLTPLTGIAISAKLSDDGKRCIMKLHGDEQALASIPEVIDAKVTISTRQ